MILTIPMNDKGYTKDFMLMKSASVAEDLSTYAVTFKAWPPGAPSTLAINATLTKSGTITGLCTYTLTPLTQTATYIGRIQMSVGSTVVKSSKPFTVEVVENG